MAETDDEKRATFLEMDAFLREGLEFEGLIEASGQKIREQSKAHYGSNLLNARLLLIAVLAHVVKVKSGQPAPTNRDISDRLVLISTFIQGISAMETLISEGQYAKAAAAMKQDYEIVARFQEIRTGTARKGENPNVRVMPKEVRQYYGELNAIAHPAREDLLSELLGRMELGEIRGVSVIPVFRPDTARGLYELHLYTLVEVARESILLLLEMYPQESELLVPSMRGFLAAGTQLEQAGFITELDQAARKK